MVLIKSKKFRIKILRFLLAILFACGFVYQTLQFLRLYWTYPTVVDIQQIAPTYVEIPAFTFCNRIGFRIENLCRGFGIKPCASSILSKTFSPVVCETYPNGCTNNTLPKDFEIIFYSKFMEQYSLTRDDFLKLALPLEDFMNCTIEYAGNVSRCNMGNVLGSFFTLDNLPQFCYTIYSKWGQPYRKREMIPKGATMKFRLFLNISRRGMDENGDWLRPLYNPPCDAVAQIAVHSPYFLPSPYLAGTSFLGGRAYELRLKQSERHLLPYPYQTNCTDYMTSWNSRNGKAPIDQLSTIQECRINKTMENLGCIPVLMDYPHPYNICKSCSPDEDRCPYTEPPNDCPNIADSFNQACHSLTYTVNKENKAIVFFRKPETFFAGPSDGFRLVLPMHDCEGQKKWRPECSTITIDVPFDQFEITNITYKPKIESLELFSAIGGYLGMWLGISLLTVLDEVLDVFVFLRSYLNKRNKSKVKRLKLAHVSKEDIKFRSYNSVFRSSRKKHLR